MLLYHNVKNQLSLFDKNMISSGKSMQRLNLLFTKVQLYFFSYIPINYTTAVRLPSYFFLLVLFLMTLFFISSELCFSFYAVNW